LFSSCLQQMPIIPPLAGEKARHVTRPKAA
jgi:hypothetical protein